MPDQRDDPSSSLSLYTRTPRSEVKRQIQRSSFCCTIRSLLFFVTGCRTRSRCGNWFRLGEVIRYRFFVIGTNWFDCWRSLRLGRRRRLRNGEVISYRFIVIWRRRRHGNLNSSLRRSATACLGRPRSLPALTRGSARGSEGRGRGGHRRAVARLPLVIGSWVVVREGAEVTARERIRLWRKT